MTTGAPRMRTLTFAFGIIGLVVGCAGKAPADDDASPDAGGPAIDAPPPDLGQTISGRSLDYFTASPLSATGVATDGIDPQMTATSSDAAAYELDHVPTGSKLFLATTRANYRTTRNLVTTVAGATVMQDIYVGSLADTNRQYSTVGILPTAEVGKAIIFAELQQADGTPLVGVPLTGITLLDATQAPVTPAGLYFIGAAGDVDEGVLTSAAFVFPTGTPSRARVALLGVPPGTYTLSVAYTGTAGPLTMTTPVTVLADGFTLVVAQASSTTTTQPSPTDPHFATDIYPLLQRAAAGGLGCANCHTAGGQAAVLPYDDPAATVLANATAITGVINLTTPATSFLLVRPLYEQPPTPQDHANATFVDITDPNYKLFLLWITNGAKP